MKKTDLEKNKGLKLSNALRQAPTFQGAGDAAKIDKREQRRLDQAKGLVPFACKLEQSLVDRLREHAAQHPEGLNGLVGDLLTKGLDALPGAAG